MKKIFQVVFTLISISAFGQAKYNPIQPPGMTFVINKPIAPSGRFSIDYRSVKGDTVNFIYRPYNGTAEVLTYLDTNYRYGWFPIVVNVGGSLQSNGRFIGGQIQLYWFRNGVADSNLVVWNTDVLSTSGFLLAANNLSDLVNASVARNNLGLGTMATQSTSASGDLSGTWPSPTVAKFNGQLPAFYLNYNNLTNKPTIPAQFNPIAGTGMSLIGTYPNIVFNSSGGGTPCLNCNADSIQMLPVDISGLRDGYVLAVDSTNGKFQLVPNGSGGSGLTALTQDVTAAGSGSQPATVVGIRTVGIPALSVGNLKYNGTAFVWDNSAASAITALTGDVTASGPGSVTATIANNAVTTAKVANNQITYAKIQQASVGSVLLGAQSIGNYQEIGLGTNLSMSGGILNAASATASSGLSKPSSDIILGEALGQSGNPAKLASNTEIPMNLKSLLFIDTLNTGSVKNYVTIFDSTQLAHAAYLKMIDNTGGATFQIWQPNNYGVQYNSPYWPTPGHMKAGLWSSGYASQASLDSMPDNVFQIFGYNEKFNSALRDTFDVGFRVAFENNFINNVGGVGLNAEYHDPAITIYGGHEYRINSYYMNKLNGITLQDKTVDNVLYFTAEDNTHALDTAYLEIFGMPAPQSSGHIVFLGHNGNNYNAGDITFQSGSFNTKINSFGTGDLDIQSNASRTPEQDFTRTGSVYLNQNSDAANSSGTTVIGNIQSGTVTPNASAQLEIYSSSRGLWMFPMTTTQMNAISSPANGLIVENRDTLLLGAGNGLCLYDSVNGVWRKIAGGGGGGGGSQTLQQVLTTGSTLTTNNTITNTSQTLSFTGGTYKFNGIPTSSGTPTILVHQTDSSLQQVGIGSGLSISSGNLIVSGGTSPPFSDGSALFKNASDNTKLLAFDLSAIATGTTRTWQFPNSNGMAAAVNLAQNWTQDQTYVNVALTLNGSSGNNIVLFQHSAVNVGVLGTEATNGGSESDMVLQTYGNHNLDFNVNAATRARINGAGNLMVGTTTDNSAFIQAAASTSSNASLYVPEGTAPSSPINGQMFAQTSDHNLYWQSQSSSICLSCTSNGIYLPTISNKNNLASSTSDSAVWSKNGNTVTVSGHVNLTSTGVSTSTQAYITLPINSLLSGGHACWGSGTNLGIGGGGAATTDAIITSDASTPNKAVITYVSGTASAVDIYYTLQYRIQ